MPKQKTHKGASKRFKRTGTGKLRRNSIGMRHKLDGKTSKQKRRLRSGDLVHKTDAARVTHVIP